jgi:hypothetical protein
MERAVAERFGDKLFPAMRSQYESFTSEERHNNFLPGNTNDKFGSCELRPITRWEQEDLSPALPYRWRECKVFVIQHPNSREFAKLFLALDPHTKSLFKSDLRHYEMFGPLAYLAWGLVRMMPLQAGTAGAVELLVKAIMLYRCKKDKKSYLTLPPLNDTTLTWDWLACISPAERFKYSFMESLFADESIYRPEYRGYPLYFHRNLSTTNKMALQPSDERELYEEKYSPKIP